MHVARTRRPRDPGRGAVVRLGADRGHRARRSRGAGCDRVARPRFPQLPQRGGDLVRRRPAVGRPSSPDTCATTFASAGGDLGLQRPQRRRAATSGSPPSPTRATSPANAGRPASISYRITPSAKMSQRSSTGLPSICSGAMYCSVPAIAPAPISVDDVTPPTLDPGQPLGEPEVQQLGAVRVSMTLPGLRSRCTSPC